MRKTLILLLTLLLALGATSTIVMAQATPAATDTEANKALIRELYDHFNANDLAGIAQLVSPTAVDHDAAPGQPSGPDGVVGAFAFLLAGFPDLKVSLEQLIAEDDFVVDRIIGLGTNTGSFAGLPPTGKPAAVEAIHIYRIENGQIAEMSHIEDLAAIFGQLGLIPGAPPAGPPATPSVVVPVSATPVDQATVEANKDLLTRMFDAVNTADVATLDSMFSPDFFNHNPNPGYPPDWEGLKATMLSFRGPFPDQVTTVNQVIGEGDLVVVHVTVRGTMEGEAYGTQPCQCKVEYDGINIVRVENGLIVENWSIYEVVSLLMQIGAIPGGQPAATPVPGPAASPVGSPVATSVDLLADYPHLLIKVTDGKFDAPAQTEGGLVAVTLQNDGSRRHTVMFLQPKEGMTVEQAMDEIKKDPTEVHIRPILTVHSGPGSTNNGASTTVLLNMAPGTYIMACFESWEDNIPDVEKGELQTIEFTAPTHADLPQPTTSDLHIDMIDFAYATFPQAIKAGRHLWYVTNTGTENHELEILKLEDGKTAQEVFSAPPQPGVPEPYVVAGGVQDLAPGGEAWAEVDLTPGNYAVFCAIPDLEHTGKPHILLGMVAGFTVV